MRKTLLYSLLITLTSLWTGAVKADEVTIDFTKKGYDNATPVIKLKQDGISLEFDSGTNSKNPPKYFTTGTAVRCYGGNWFSVTAASATITKIVFTFDRGEGSNAITADAGTFSTNTWTGSSSSVKFTIGGTTGHRRIQKMVVTTGEGGDTPVPQVVPTVTLPYEEAFVGVGKGKFYIEDVNKGDLSYVWNYDSQFGMKASAYASGTAYATESWLISPLIDLTNASDPIFTFDHAVNKFTSVEKAKEEATVWVRIGEDGVWYQVSNVTYPSSLGWTFENAGELPLDEFVDKKIQIGFKYTSTATNAGTWEIKNFKVNDGEIVITYDDMTVAELCELTEKTDNINLTFNNAQVVFVDGRSAYIREGENAICAYDLGIDLNEGQTINGSVKVNFELHRGMHEIKANTATTDSELTITDAAAGATVAPTEATLSELLKGKHAADYIVLRGVQIISVEAASGAKGLNGATAETTTYYAADEAGAKIQLFSPSDDITAKANDGKKYDIEAIFAGAGTNKSITPLAISETTAINNITTDEALKQNTPIYNLAGQRVGESYKGIVIVNGKKIKK